MKNSPDNPNSPNGSPKKSKRSFLANSNALGKFRYKLKNERERRNLTQIELAEKAGVNRRMIQKYEAGEGVPSTKTLSLLAKALNTTPSDLLSEESFQIKDISIPHYGFSKEESDLRHALGRQRLEDTLGWYFDRIKDIFEKNHMDMKKPENVFLFQDLLELFREVTRRY
jgi:transcriptional regulator with XRE-family HTH domain